MRWACLSTNGRGMALTHSAKRLPVVGFSPFNAVMQLKFYDELLIIFVAYIINVMPCIVRNQAPFIQALSVQKVIW